MHQSPVTGLVIPQLLHCSRENSSGEGRRTFRRAHGLALANHVASSQSRLRRLFAKGSTGRSTLWPQALATNHLTAVLLVFVPEIGALQHAVHLAACRRDERRNCRCW